MDLVGVLTEMEDPKTFLRNNRRSQKIILEATFGEGHELVESILDSISPVKVHHKHSKAFTSYHRRTTLCLAHDCLVIVHHTLPPHTPPQPPTLGSRIEEYLLAPSRVKETEVVDVACYLFGEAFAIKATALSVCARRKLILSLACAIVNNKSTEVQTLGALK